MGSHHLSLAIEATRHCNFRCIHCFRADIDKASEIPFETVQKILEGAKRYHRPHIALTGGEATLHSRFVDILELLIRHDFTFHYVTNGWNYQTTFKRLYHLFGDPHWTSIGVSLDGATAKTHDAIRRKGSFSRVLATIAVAVAHNLKPAVAMAIHRGNRHELERLALLCSKMGVDRFLVVHLQPTFHTVAKNLMLSPEEFRAVERQVQDLAADLKMQVSFAAGYYDHTPLAHCGFLQLNSLNIDHKGRLTVCCQLSNAEGGVDDEDVVADLNVTPLETAHMQLLRKYFELFEERLSNMRKGTLSDLDHFHCWHCLKHFKKVEWMRKYPENEWVRSDPYFHPKEGEKR